MKNKIQTSPITTELLAVAQASTPTGMMDDEGHNWWRTRQVKISGDDVARLMRKCGWTIKRIAEEHGLTQKRVREWRNEGLTGWCAVNAIWCITGVWIA